MPRRIGRPALAPMVSIGFQGELIRAEDVQALAGQAGLPLIADSGAIAAKLTETMRRFIADARMQAADAPGDTAQWAREVADAAGKLAAVLGEVEPGDEAHPEDGSGYYPLIRNLPLKPNDDLDFNLRRHAIGRAARNAFQEPNNKSLSNFDAMGIALVSVEYIRRAAELTAEHWEARKGAGRSANHAEKALFQDICAIYREAFGRKAGASRPEGGGLPFGPAMRFCQALFTALPARAAEVLDGSARDLTWRARFAELAAEESAEGLSKLIQAGARMAK